MFLKILFTLLVAGAASAIAADLDNKPFAEHHIILQVSDADPAKYAATLDIANNLIKHYQGPDFVDVEVVAFGKGVQMYYAGTNAGVNVTNNSNKGRIDSLINNGVRFYVCLNTIDTIQRKTGKRPILIDGVEGVQTGVAFMLEEIESGYTHIHP
jgi:intracellular sulfur oxidation DsrE/DsrF family protein